MNCIALIAGTYQPASCGVAHYTAHLREILATKGINTIVLTTHQAAQESNEPNVLGVVERWHWQEMLPLLRSLHSLKFDLLHIQHAAGTYSFDRSIFLLPLLLKLTRWQVPIVTTIHEYGWWEWQPPYIPLQLLEGIKMWGQQQRWWDREDGFLLTQSQAIITTNNEAENIIIQRLPELSHRVHRIPIGANIKVVDSDLEKRTHARKQLQNNCGWSDDTIIIVFFGFLHPVKGLEILIPAFKQVLSSQPQARLLLLGGVESLALPKKQAEQYWNQLTTLIEELELSDFVHMTGYLDSDTVSHYLTGADIGVLPFNHGVTLKSGSLLALMTHHLPVIATRSNSPDPILEDENLVRSIDPRNQKQLVRELIELISDPDSRFELGEAGYNFSQQFTWPSIVSKHLEIYRSLLSYPLEIRA